MNLEPRQVAGVWVQPVDMALCTTPQDICKSCCMDSSSDADCLAIDYTGVYFTKI